MDQVMILKAAPQTSEVIWGDGSWAKKYNAEVAPGVDINHVAGVSSFGSEDTILTGEFAGKTIGWLYDNHKEYFGTPDEIRWQDILPVGAGMAYASENLSVQVHPREDWAMEHLGMHGKSESWYIVDCPENADIVMGHRAKSFEELDDYIAREDWEGLMTRYPIHPGSFYAIKAGTLHAIQKGTAFIEICNPCPVTYRFYDWDRVGLDGKPRYIDIDKTRQNILVPYQRIQFPPIISQYGGVKETWLANNEDYSVWTYEVDGKGTVPRKKPFIGGLMIEGEGTINGMELKPVTPFFVSRGCKDFVLEGRMKLLCCHG